MNQKDVWSTIADSWTNFRTKPEKEVIEFSQNSRSVLDLGCGNCRNVVPFLEKNKFCVGLDFSKNMIKEAKIFLSKRKLAAHLIIGNTSKLPFKNNVFSNIVCTRVLHHLESKEMRIESLKEMKRVGEKTLITVWKKWQNRFFWKLIKNRFSSDICVEWNYHGKIYNRFYHLYTKKELKTELSIVGLKTEKLWEDSSGNICMIVKQ